MGKGFFEVPTAINEPVKGYAPGSPERAEVLKQYEEFYNQQIDIPMYIGGEEVRTNNKRPLSPPHDHMHQVGEYSLASAEHVDHAISNALWKAEASGPRCAGNSVLPSF